MLVRFWSTGCADCIRDFLDLETTYRMYRQRAFDLVTISTDPPASLRPSWSFSGNSTIEPEQAVGTIDRATLQAAWGRSGASVRR